MKKQTLFYISLFYFLIIVPGTVTESAFGQPLPETKGYLGLDWGVSLAKAEKDKGLLSVTSMDRIAARAVDYLLMEYHEVQPDDPSRPKAFSVLKAAGDDTSYVFYDGKYCLALTPVQEKDEEQVRKAIEQKYKPSDSKDYRSVLDNDSADDGWHMLQLLYARYETGSASRVYFVKAGTYYSDISDPTKPAGDFLIYVSDDYFKNSAYLQWRKNSAESPNREKWEADKKTLTDMAKIQ